MFELGSTLREARTRQGLELRDAAEATRIRVKFLAALEGERVGELPPEFYARAFLRTYAEFLGLDGDVYVAELNSLLEARRPPPRRPLSRVPRCRASIGGPRLWSAAPRPSSSCRSSRGTTAAVLSRVRDRPPRPRLRVRRRRSRTGQPRRHAPVVPRSPASFSLPHAGTAGSRFGRGRGTAACWTRACSARAPLSVLLPSASGSASARPGTSTRDSTGGHCEACRQTRATSS
jgi:transcriptional regulator with XRE-family HTH domain